MSAAAAEEFVNAVSSMRLSAGRVDEVRMTEAEAVEFLATLADHNGLDVHTDVQRGQASTSSPRDSRVVGQAVHTLSSLHHDGQDVHTDVQRGQVVHTPTLSTRAVGQDVHTLSSLQHSGQVVQADGQVVHTSASVERDNQVVQAGGQGVHTTVSPKQLVERVCGSTAQSVVTENMLSASSLSDIAELVRKMSATEISEAFLELGAVCRQNAAFATDDSSSFPVSVNVCRIPVLSRSVCSSSTTVCSDGKSIEPDCVCKPNCSVLNDGFVCQPVYQYRQQQFEANQPTGSGCTTDT